MNKATEADEKVNEIKASRPEDVDGSMGWFCLLYTSVVLRVGDQQYVAYFSCNCQF